MKLSATRETNLLKKKLKNIKANREPVSKCFLGLNFSILIDLIRIFIFRVCNWKFFFLISRSLLLIGSTSKVNRKNKMIFLHYLSQKVGNVPGITLFFLLRHSETFLWETILNWIYFFPTQYTVFFSLIFQNVLSKNQNYNWAIMMIV